MEPAIPRARSEPLARGELAKILYRLGRSQADGVLTVSTTARHDVFVIRRGHLLTSERDVAGGGAVGRLARAVSLDDARWSFEGGTAAAPPGGSPQAVLLTRWVREHLESQLDRARADRLVAALTGLRVSLRPGHALDPAILDETDRRIVAALAQPRRLDQIWTQARAPRFRLLAFLYFLRAVEGLETVGAGADSSRFHVPDPRSAALRALGLPPGADTAEIKRAYRRLARILHPDLHPDAGDDRRRQLERRLAEVTAAYQRATAG